MPRWTEAPATVTLVAYDVPLPPSPDGDALPGMGGDSSGQRNTIARVVPAVRVGPEVLGLPAAPRCGRPDDPHRCERRVAGLPDAGRSRDPAHRAAAGRRRCRRNRGGPGADWLLEQLPAMLGANDNPDDMVLPPGKLRDVQRRNPGLRLGATGLVVESLIPSILEQRVPGASSRKSASTTWARPFRRAGEPSPGPGLHGRRPLSPSDPAGPAPLVPEVIITAARAGPLLRATVRIREVRRSERVAPSRRTACSTRSGWKSAIRRSSTSWNSVVAKSLIAMTAGQGPTVDEYSMSGRWQAGHSSWRPSGVITVPQPRQSAQSRA
ncbi:hypothetical protein BX265_7282 [Streptomyces sp. TLI_235]|nr:hypothetical protein BX265_7282 [Streptomyces sp. TLI_235]